MITGYVNVLVVLMIKREKNYVHHVIILVSSVKDQVNKNVLNVKEKWEEKWKLSMDY